MALFTPARRNVPELLDREDNALDEHLASLKDLQGFNRDWGGTRIILEELARAVGIAYCGSRIADCGTAPNVDTTTNHKPPTLKLTVLDVGTASADIPRAVAAWGRERGIAVRAIGVDLHPLNLRIARRETQRGRAATAIKHQATKPPRRTKKMSFDLSALVSSCLKPARRKRLVTSRFDDLVAQGEPGVALVRGDGLRLPFRDGGADVVFCSLFLHHFTEPEAVRLLREFSRVARRAVIVSDLHRSWFLYFSLKLLTKWTARSRLTKFDGPVSALRAFTVGEARALAREAGMVRYTVTRRPSFRWVLSMVK